MEKLIDAAELKKQFADTDWETNNAICKIIDEQKPVDAVPVIRCKDCKHHRGENACEKDGCYGWYDTDYCSRAERRGEDGKTD